MNAPSETDTLRGTTRWQWTFATIVSINFLIYGMEAGWISPMSHDLQSSSSPLERPVTNTDLSFLASIVSFVAAFLVPLFSYLADCFGRKLIISITPFPQIISILLRIVFPNFMVLAIARALAGMSASGTFIVTTVYLREISQRNMIATLGSLATLMQNTGFFTMFLIGALCDNYFTILWIFLIMPILSAALCTTIPESPEFLVKADKIDRAQETVAFLRGLSKDDPIVTSEIEYLKRLEDEHKKAAKISFISIIKDQVWRRGFFIILVLFTIHAWNGAFTVLVFASTILETSELGEFNVIHPEIQTLSFPLVMILASFTFIFIADKFGRRHILATGFSVSAIAFLFLGILTKFHFEGYHSPPWIPLVTMIVIVIMYSAGVRPLPCIIATEIFSFKIRAKMMGFLISYSWIVVSTQLFIYGPFVDNIGLPYLFIMYGIMNIIGLIASLLLPETRHRSAEEITSMLYDRRTT